MLQTLAHDCSDTTEEQALSAPRLKARGPLLGRACSTYPGDGTAEGKAETGLWCPLLFSTPVPLSEGWH